MEAVEKVDKVIDRGALDAEAPREVDNCSEFLCHAIGFEALVDCESGVASQGQHRYLTQVDKTAGGSFFFECFERLLAVVWFVPERGMVEVAADAAVQVGFEVDSVE